MHNKKFIEDLMECKDDKAISWTHAKDFLSTTLLIPGYFQSLAGNNFFMQSLAISEKAKGYQNIVFI